MKWLYFRVEQNFAPVIHTSWIMKGQLMKSELTYHFGSYLLWRRLSRFYVKFNNPGKTQRSLHSTPLMTHCPSIDNLFWETSFDPTSLNTHARNKTTLHSKYGSSDFEIMVKNMYTKCDGDGRWPPPPPPPFSLSFFYGHSWARHMAA